MRRCPQRSLLFVFFRQQTKMFFRLGYICLSCALQVQSSTVIMPLSEGNVTGNPVTTLKKTQDDQPQNHSTIGLPARDDQRIDMGTIGLPTRDDQRIDMGTIGLPVRDDQRTDLGTIGLPARDDQQTDFGTKGLPARDNQPTDLGTIGLPTAQSDEAESSRLVSKTVRAIRPETKGFTTSSLGNLATECSSDAERVCGCNYSCVLLNNCCYDSQFIGLDAPQNGLSLCVDSIKSKVVLTSPAFLIAKCPNGWQNDIVRENCERPSEDKIFTNIPCYSPDTDFSYLNQFCSECHGVTKCHLWELTFQSNNPYIEYSSIDTVDKMVAFSARRPLSRRGAQFVVSSGLSPVSHCILQPIVESCVAEFSSETLARHCHTYFNPVTISRRVYRNIHCFLCSTGISPEDVVVAPYFQKIHLSPISILLDLQREKTEQRKGDDIKPIITRIRGYCQGVDVYIRVSNMVGVEIRKRDEMRKHCAAFIRSLLHYMLRDYDAKTRFRAKTFNDTQLSFYVTVLITDIFVEQILEINRKVRKLEFDSKFGEYNVSCCFYRNGTKWYSSASNDAGNVSLKKAAKENHFNSSLSNRGQILKTKHPALVFAVTIFSIWVKWNGVS